MSRKSLLKLKRDKTITNQNKKIKKKTGRCLYKNRFTKKKN